MTAGREITWAKVAAIIGAAAGLATLHGAVVVPQILDRAEIRAVALIEANNVTALEPFRLHLDEVEAIRAKYVSRDELVLLRGELDRIHAQLDRIEEKLGR